jgi:hypothetical protein
MGGQRAIEQDGNGMSSPAFVASRLPLMFGDNVHLPGSDRAGRSYPKDRMAEATACLFLVIYSGMES